MNICTMYTYEENVHKSIINITNEYKWSKHCFDLNTNQIFWFQTSLLIEQYKKSLTPEKMTAFPKDFRACLAHEYKSMGGRKARRYCN